MWNNGLNLKSEALLMIGVTLVAFNLRTPITSVGPLAGLIRTDLGISNTGIGFIMTLSLLVFALFSPIAAKIGNLIGNERAVFVGLLILLLGEGVRSTGQSADFLYWGTILIGIGIAIGNVLIPSIIKCRFPAKIGLLTSIYTTSMTVFAALGAGISIPLAENFQSSWRASLLCWGGLLFVALVAWLPQISLSSTAGQVQIAAESRKTVWKSPLAWAVSLFMGLQCLFLYSIIAWLPEILRGYGIDIASAGWMLSWFQFASMPTSFLAPIIAGRYDNQKGITAISGLFCLVGLIGLLSGGNIVWLSVWLLLISIGGGACFSLAFTFIGLRSENSKQAAELSGMAQLIGYLLAAGGPSLIGYLYDSTGSWTIPMLLFIAMSIAMIGIGVIVGRKRHIFDEG